MVEVIITEKPSVAKKFACGVCPLTECDMRSCRFYNSDIFIHRHQGELDFDITCLKLKIPKAKHRTYWANTSIDWSRTTIVYSSLLRGLSEGVIDKSFRSLLQIKESNVKPKYSIEKVGWYVIPSGHQHKSWVIFYTLGNPVKARLSRKYALTNNIQNFKEFKKRIIEDVRYLPYSNRSRYTVMLCHLIGRILTDAYQNEYLVNVATDADIAGTYLVTRLPGFYRLNENQIKRLFVNDTTPVGIKSALSESKRFDWHNAEVGRFRDLFDFVFGSLLRIEINKRGKYVSNKYPISLGRTRLLALDCICRSFWMENVYQEKANIFLLIPGIGNQEGIKSAIRDNECVYIGAKGYHEVFNVSKLVRKLTELGIGTVSTRIRLIESLVKQGAITIVNGAIIPTEVGIHIEKLYLDVFETDTFSLAEANNRINELLLMYGNDTIPDLDKLQEDINVLIYKYYTSLVELFKGSAALLDNFIITLNSKPRASNPKEVLDNDKLLKMDVADRSAQNGLFGNQPLCKYEKYIDRTKNILKCNTSVLIERHIEDEEMDFVRLIKQHLRLSQSSRIDTIKAVNTEKLLASEIGDYTIFSAEVPLEKIDAFFRRLIKNRNHPNQFAYLSLEQFGNVDLIEGKQPLEIFDPTPSDLEGPEAFIIVKEYMRPYKSTVLIYESLESGVSLVNEFNLRIMRFKRLNPFVYGTAHTLDTLVATGYDLYGFSLQKTAKIAESLYLNGG